MKILQEYSLLIKNIHQTIGVYFYCYVLLIILTGMMEGVSLASIIPLLSMIGVSSAGALPRNGISSIVLQILQHLNLQPSIGAIAVFITASLVLSASLFFAQAGLGAYLQTLYVYRWQQSLSRAILNADLTFFYDRKFGVLINSIVTETQRLGAAFYQSGLLIAGVIHATIFLLIALTLSVSVTGAIMIGCVVLFLLTKRLIYRAFKIGKNISETNAEFQIINQDFIFGIKLIKTTATEDRAFEKISDVANRLRLHSYENSFDIQLAKGVFDFGAALMAAAVLIAGSTFFIVDPAVTLVILAIFIRLMPKLTGIHQSVQSLSSSLPVIFLLRDVMRSAEKSREPCLAYRPNIMQNHGSIAISINNLSVSYGVVNAISDINLHISPGSSIALVGASGSGKSTLIDAILGLVPIKTGQIKINGVSLDQIPLSSLRQRVGYMTQETVLFNGTILDNLLWRVNSNIDDKAIDNALRISAADGFVSRLEQGVNSLINNGGTSFSGGERQRLGLARAIIGDPGLIILDEATSALDSETENDINNALAEIRGKATILMIAHRLSAVRMVDCIYVMDNGRIVESGTWEELISQNGIFKRIWNLQSSPKN